MQLIMLYLRFYITEYQVLKHFGLMVARLMCDFFNLAVSRKEKKSQAALSYLHCLILVMYQ